MNPSRWVPVQLANAPAYIDELYCWVIPTDKFKRTLVAGTAEDGQIYVLVRDTKENTIQAWLVNLQKQKT